MSNSASLPKQPYEDFDPHASSEQQSATPAWKQEVNQRLAAHRTRRGGPQESSGQASEEHPRAASKRASDAAARVAARYAKAPSYSEVLAGEARVVAGEARAMVRAAEAAAQAARNAQAAAQAVLAGLESTSNSTLWDQAAFATPPAAAAPPVHAAPPRWQDEAPVASPSQPQNPWAGAQPRWEEALPVTAPPPSAGRDVWSEMRVHAEPAVAAKRTPSYSQRSSDEADLFDYQAQDQELMDAYDPLASATVEPVQPIAANLIEFPRELVAARKARPRLAEGPFYDPAQESPQLSIFEVDPDLLAPPIHFSDHGRDPIAPPEWATIELDHPVQARPEPGYATPVSYAHPAYVEERSQPIAYANEFAFDAAEVDFSEARVAPASYPAYTNSLPAARAAESEERLAREVRTPAAMAPAAELIIAPLSDRLLAGVVDGALVTLAFLAAAVVVIASTNHPPTGRIALIASCCGLILFGLLYQFLFFSYAEEGTPGMRYARVALCTFDDDNPTREQMRRRIPAMLLAALPAGLGLLWALVDGDHLALHDRLTRTYQRKY